MAAYDYGDPSLMYNGGNWGGYDPSGSTGYPQDFPVPSGATLQVDPTIDPATGRKKVQPVPDYQQPAQTSSAAAPTAASGPSASDIGAAYQQSLGRAPNANEMAWEAGDPNWLATIKNSPEAAAFAKGSANPNPNDPNYSLLMNTVLSRLKQLSQPVDTTAQNAFITQALARVQQLNGPPFSDQQSAAMLAQNMNPLTQARDSAKQQAADALARRGISPSSGVFIDTMNKIDQAHEKGVANVTNTLNMKGIDQATQNANTQLAILNSIVEMNKATAAQQEGLSSQLVPTAATMTGLDTQRLGAVNQTASLDNPNSLITALLSLGQLGLNNQGQQNTANAASSAAMAQLIYALMNGTAGLFS